MEACLEPGLGVERRGREHSPLRKDSRQEGHRRVVEVRRLVPSPLACTGLQKPVAHFMYITSMRISHQVQVRCAFATL
jgi:hypothetical protein